MLPTLLLQPSDVATFETALNAPNLLPEGATDPVIGFADLLGLSARPLPEPALPAGLALPVAGKDLPPAAKQPGLGRVAITSAIPLQIPAGAAVTAALPITDAPAAEPLQMTERARPLLTPLAPKPAELRVLNQPAPTLPLVRPTPGSSPAAQPVQQATPDAPGGATAMIELASRNVRHADGPLPPKLPAMPATSNPPLTAATRQTPPVATGAGVTAPTDSALNPGVLRALPPGGPARALPARDPAGPAPTPGKETVSRGPRPQPALTIQTTSTIAPTPPTVTAAEPFPVLPATTNAAAITPTPVQYAAEAPALSGATSPRIDVPVQHDAWGEQLGQRLQLLANGRLQSAEIRLTPAELGPLRVQIAMDDGAATVTFQAQHALTREAIEQALPRLREMLAEQGVPLNQANISEQGVARDGGRSGNETQNVTPGEADAGIDSDADGGTTGPLPRRDPDGLVDTFA